MGKHDTADIDYTVHPRVNSNDPVAPCPRPTTPAYILKDDADAIRVARGHTSPDGAAIDAKPALVTGFCIRPADGRSPLSDHARTGSRDMQRIGGVDPAGLRFYRFDCSTFHYQSRRTDQAALATRITSPQNDA